MLNPTWRKTMLATWGLLPQLRCVTTRLGGCLCTPRWSGYGTWHWRTLRRAWSSWWRRVSVGVEIGAWEGRVYENGRCVAEWEQGYHGQQMLHTGPPGPQPRAVRPRVRARRGQATDPHSIAERLRRERIAEKIRALQELVPSVNKTDRAAMLDEIVDYVKFLRLQVKVLSMSRLGGAGAVAPLVTDIPITSVEEEGINSGRAQPAWEKWSNDGTEHEVANLMEENVGVAIQFLQSKALCIMPISLASAIYHIQPPDTATFIKSESNPFITLQNQIYAHLEVK